MTKLEVIDLMKSSQTHEEWRANCNKVKAAHGGDYPDYWYDTIIRSDMGDKIYGPDSRKFTVIPIEKPKDIINYLQGQRSSIQCKKCHRKPDEIEEYIEFAKDCDMIPEEYVREEEGTFNPETGMFYCTDCYITIGMPLGVA